MNCVKNQLIFDLFYAAILSLSCKSYYLCSCWRPSPTSKNQIPLSGAFSRPVAKPLLISNIFKHQSSNTYAQVRDLRKKMRFIKKTQPQQASFYTPQKIKQFKIKILLLH
jgi:hypothetical protein